jgi:hypothetical protein
MAESVSPASFHIAANEAAHCSPSISHKGQSDLTLRNDPRFQKVCAGDKAMVLKTLP